MNKINKVDRYSESYITQLKEYLPGTESSNLPSFIDIGLTENCNLQCIMCRIPGQPLTGTMTFEIFKKVIDETAPQALCFNLQHSGESLLLPDFKERLEYLASKKRKDTVIELFTNGMLLDHDTAELLIKHQVRLYVSFDGADASSFESIRLGADFKKICRNLLHFSNVAASAPYPLAGINITIQKKNFLEISHIVEIAHSLNVKRVSFSVIQDPIEEKADLTYELINEIEHAISTALKYNMLVPFFPTRLGNRVWKNNRFVSAGDTAIKTYCDVPAFFATVKPNGDIWVCCRNVVKVGNIQKDRLADIWSGPRIKSILKVINGRNVNLFPSCTNCVYANRYRAN